ncbi:hemojuvelin [Anguilla anguilla]|uniref:hemojuvelin n=1 Tax=Anguilla anguilla TaxID=7936 RepID=UPI0015A8443E|nr:hemojuvelin [Anguilla anguilla]XP_035262164.1 hemojuvelin [Anguilla anguilla]XP_035262174.1 hemojuvelin [Anguilla anguilla]
MGKLPVCSSYTLLSWKRSIAVALLLSQLCCSQVWAQCRILRCNSEYVTATQHLGGREGADTRYCSPLRSYAHCTKKMARACRGDLAYHSAVQGIEDLLIQHGCPKTGPTAQPRPPPQAPLSGDACCYERVYQQRQGRLPEYVHCGVFGDPHVRTFQDEFQTCAVQGAWPLIDNEYLYVQATSAPMGGGAYATALTKITIIFKNWRECIDQQIYQAELDDVPPAFVDGSMVGGERRGQHSLQVRTQDPGRQAEIWAAHIGTTLVVRQSGRSLGLAVRAPRAIVDTFTPEQDLQLCMWGCPASQQLARPPAQPSTNAHAHCSALLPVQDVYFQACVFDLLATGDVNSSAAAVAALEDARVMLSDSDKVHLVTAGTAQHLPRLPVVLAMVILAGQLLNLLTDQ